MHQRQYDRNKQGSPRSRPPGALKAADTGDAPIGASLPTPWALPSEQVLRRLVTSRERGLTLREVRVRQRIYGHNRLREAPRRSSLKVLVEQFSSLIVALLAGAAGVAFLLGEMVEGVAIVAVIAINAGIGFVTEVRAVRSMEALRELGARETVVRRAGRVAAVPAVGLVPGDIVILDAGDMLSADVRVVSGSRLQADESTLTGESLPTDKHSSPVAAEAPLAERASMLFKGTAVTRGAGEGVVVATGMHTELGDISALVEGARPASTPLEKRLDKLARRLVGLTVAVAVLVAGAVVISGRDLYLAVEIAIALAVATIPEGLPIVATVALARGMWRMARRHALVEQLAAVETLGSTSVLLTDKTGTLTENAMTVVELRVAEGRVSLEGTGHATAGVFRIDGRTVEVAQQSTLAEALRTGVLCNDASLNRDAEGTTQPTGDPTEVALLVAGAKAGFERTALDDDWPRIDEVAFDSQSKRMATLHRHTESMIAAVKGAPEAIMACCAAVRTASETLPLDEVERTRWMQQANDMAATGQRVLALATKSLEAGARFQYDNLVLLALVGLTDPPRAPVRAAIDACQDAGVRVIMVTGDHGATGFNVAAAVGLIDPPPGAPVRYVDGSTLPSIAELSTAQSDELLDAAVIARATPRQKLDLIDLHQRSGAVVAMIGDGVNDAPALKKADIGIAMGIRGTQVAREAADMVLRDDELGSVVAAIEQGRAIYANIRKFVIYLMSCNVSEILAVGLGVLAQGPLPILPLQILFLNLVTDVFPALALGVCEGNPSLMREPPRDPREPLLTRTHWREIFVMGAVIAVCVLGALALSVTWLGKPEGDATTIAFLTLAMAQLWHVFSMRNPSSTWLRNEVSSNGWVWAALVLCLGLLLLAVYWQPLANVLSIGDPGLSGWTLALGASVVPLVVGQLLLLRGARLTRSPPDR